MIFQTQHKGICKMLYYVYFIFCNMQAKHSHLGLGISNLKELEVGKILQYDAKKGKIWIYRSKSFKNMLRGYLLTNLWKMLVFNKISIEKKKNDILLALECMCFRWLKHLYLRIS